MGNHAAMNKLSAKEYLRQLRSLDVEIRVKLEECERVRGMATRTGVSLSFDRVMSSNSSTSKIEDCVIKLVMLEEELHHDIAHLASIKSETLSMINKMEVSDYRTLLTLRYVTNITWEEIAVKMNFSYRHTLRMHGCALLDFENIYASE